MLRSLTLSSALVIATLEPALESDPFRYSITQGGLLAVVLVLLWYIRNRHRDELAQEKDRTAAAESSIATLIELVGDTKATMQKNISVGEAQEKAIHRLARAVERIEDRRDGSDRRGTT